MVKGIINAFDIMEFCLVINLTIGGKRAVTRPPIIATWNVGFKYQVARNKLASFKKRNPKAWEAIV